MKKVNSRPLCGSGVHCDDLDHPSFSFFYYSFFFPLLLLHTSVHILIRSTNLFSAGIEAFIYRSRYRHPFIFPCFCFSPKFSFSISRAHVKNSHLLSLNCHYNSNFNTPGQKSFSPAQNITVLFCYQSQNFTGFTLLILVSTFLCGFRLRATFQTLSFVCFQPWFLFS